MGHEHDFIFYVVEWERYVKYLLLLNFPLFSTFSMKFCFCFYLTDFTLNQTLFWSKWLKWKCRRQPRLSNSGIFEQDLIFYVTEWKLYVKYSLLLNFRLFSTFTMKKKSSFLFLLLSNWFLRWTKLCFGLNGWNEKVEDRQDSQIVESLK